MPRRTWYVITTNINAVQMAADARAQLGEFPTRQFQEKNSDGCDKLPKPVEFITICLLAFGASVAATAYFCASMCSEMEMPGGWTMSMMWMPMDGQTWFASATSFLLMWLAMMVAMMLPSALPTFLRVRRQWASLSCIASGYFVIWLAAGVGIYALGATFAAIAIRSELFSHAVPWLVGASLIVAGTAQFTRWKMTYLLRCRSLFGCGISCLKHESSFQIGCKQGLACCLCCAAPMVIQLALGIMNPLLMIVVALIIAAEKLLRRPAAVARIVGLFAIVAGVASFVVSLRTS
jgi:predicted metal-binding membrane protein